MCMYWVYYPVHWAYYMKRENPLGFLVVSFLTWMFISEMRCQYSDFNSQLYI